MCPRTATSEQLQWLWNNFVTTWSYLSTVIIPWGGFYTIIQYHSWENQIREVGLLLHGRTALRTTLRTEWWFVLAKAQCLWPLNCASHKTACPQSDLRGPEGLLPRVHLLPAPLMCQLGLPSHTGSYTCMECQGPPLEWLQMNSGGP
jgi:hypothetical protein